MYAILVKEDTELGLYTKVYTDLVEIRTNVKQLNLEEIEVALDMDVEDLTQEEIKEIQQRNKYIRQFKVVELVEI